MKYHLGAQNDALYIIQGEAPSAAGNDYPRHDADRQAIARVLDEALARELVDAANAKPITCDKTDARAIAIEQAIAPAGTRSAGVDLIAKERQRQILKEGWTAEHDDDHDDHSLALAAALYASPIALYEVNVTPERAYWLDPWAWDAEWDKRPRYGSGKLKDAADTSPKVRIRCLAKAGALIAAEIDRLLRAQADVREASTAGANHGL